MDPAGTVVTIIAAIVGMEVLKKIIMDRIFPPASIFGKDERKIFYEMKNSLKDLPKECPTLTEDEHDALMDLLKMHDVKDMDGVPLWYVPRSWQKTQEETLKVTQEIAFAQKETAKALEGLLKVIERLADKVSDLGR
jgi:hypothetical protein